MSQHSYNVANQLAAAFRADLNNAFQALASNNAGAAEPATKYAYMWWADTTTGLLKQRNAANTAWSSIGALADLGIQSSAQIISAASGTADAITGSYTPAITALTNGMTLYVRTGTANATTTPTFAPNGLTAKTIVKGNGLALAAGDIAGGGHWIELQYDLTLDKWVLLNPAKGVSVASSASIQGAFKNLQASATGLSANVSVTADEIAVENAANAYQTLRAVNLTISGTSSGVANGLDTGALAINTWYSVWVIWNGMTTAGLLSLSATAPTLPSGYTHKARIGWIRTDGSANKYPLGFMQNGRRVQYLVAAGSNVPLLPLMASGVLGTFSTTTITWAAVAVGGYIPTTATRINFSIANYYNGGPLSAVTVAPNSTYTGSNTTNSAPVLIGANTTEAKCFQCDYALESQNLYAASTTAGCGIQCFGWEDNI